MQLKVRNLVAILPLLYHDSASKLGKNQNLLLHNKVAHIKKFLAFMQFIIPNAMYSFLVVCETM